ncbi:S8 family serine peptidase [Streptomyces sp. NPDC048277]|uniref:S8 family serine peptidase n=1 Tax=Streptomyces sp. NPDC048277 TaxID=3155027 RepID=UPI0033FBBF09
MTEAAATPGVLAGMEWAVQQRAKIVSMSLGSTDFAGADPIEQAVNDLSKSSGALFTIAAGNDGPGDATMGSPGSAEQALAVAAVDHDDKLADFSSRGPTADSALKPDISAPGVDITAAKAAHSSDEDEATPGYVTYSGTSMATPATAGAAAIVAQEHPDWNGQRIKAALLASAKPLPGQGAYAVGAGRVDLARAIRQTVTTEPASADLGVQLWPHGDDQPVRRTVTYRNTGDRPVTLDLALTDRVAPGGRAVTTGVFTLSPARLTVPADGTADATVTADTRADGLADGPWSAAVTATGDGQSVRTPVGVVREAESYTLTIRATGRDGKPAPDTDLTIGGLDSGRLYRPYDAGDKDQDGVVTVRLPKGRYTLDAQILPSAQGGAVSWLVTPKLVMDRDRTLTLDARTAKPVHVRAPDAGARLRGAQMAFSARGATDYAGALLTDDYTHVFAAQAGPGAPPKDFIVQFGGIWQRGAADPQYDLVVTRRGTMFTGLDRRVSAHGLAKVVMSVGSVAAGTRATPYTRWEVPGWDALALAVGPVEGATRKAPVSGIHYLSTGADLRWELDNYLDTATHRDLGSWQTQVRRYRADHTYRETFNTAVFGPSFGSADGAGTYEGKAYWICLGMFDDGAGHAGYPEASEITVHARLSTGGTVVADRKEDCFNGSGFPDRPARYRLAVDASRSASVYHVGTRVSVVWDFAVRPVASPGSGTMPLSVVRFTPRLGLDSTARAGSRITVPLVIRGAAAAPGALRTLTVQVSYDGGHTWKGSAVHTASDGRRSVTLTQPATPGTVSFKATATDTGGNRVTQTLIDAYRTVS